MPDGSDVTLTQTYQFISSGGFPAIFLLIVWTGYRRVWVWGKENDREIARANKAEAERDKAVRFVQDKALPAIIAFTQAANRILEKEQRRE